MRALAPFLLALAAFAATGDSLAQTEHPALKDPSKATEKAPDVFTAKFVTTKGDVVFECTRAWSPNGVDRFYNLVKIGFFTDIALFRVKKDFVVQWGIHGDPEVSKQWMGAQIPADPVKESNKRGTLTFAMSGPPTTRTTQVFINYKDNVQLDRMGFGPVCKVTSGMEVADKFYGDYEEQVTSKQGEITQQGNAYLREAWPNLDYIKSASITSEKGGGGDGKPAAPAGAAPESDKTIFWVLGVLAVAVGVIWFVTNRDKADAAAKKPQPSKAPAPKPAGTAASGGGPVRKKKKKGPRS